MMLRLFVAVWCALWLGTAGAAPAGDASTVARRGFLWEAHKGAARVYVLGTIHVGRADFYPLDADLMARLRAADAIAVEADMSEAARVAPLVQQIAYYPDGEPGLDARRPALRARLEQLAQRDGLLPTVFWRMKPWMLANTLVMLEAARLGFSPAYATEAFLFEFARQSGKPLAEVESVEAQLRLFDSAPESLQFAYLQQTIDSIASGESQGELRALVDAWSRRDRAAMQRLVERMRGTPGAAAQFIVSRVLDGRHPRMADAIERFAASGRLYVVALGALHFFGPSGLIELLKQRGYTVVPLD